MAAGALFHLFCFLITLVLCSDGVHTDGKILNAHIYVQCYIVWCHRKLKPWECQKQFGLMVLEYYS
jgi:hypothetical protein